MRGPRFQELQKTLGGLNEPLVGVFDGLNHENTLQLTGSFMRTTEVPLQTVITCQFLETVRLGDRNFGLEASSTMKVFGRSTMTLNRNISWRGMAIPTLCDVVQPVSRLIFGP